MSERELEGPVWIAVPPRPSRAARRAARTLGRALGGAGVASSVEHRTDPTGRGILVLVAPEQWDLSDLARALGPSQETLAVQMPLGNGEPGGVGPMELADWLRARLLLGVPRLDPRGSPRDWADVLRSRPTPRQAVDPDLLAGALRTLTDLERVQHWGRYLAREQAIRTRTRHLPRFLLAPLWRLGRALAKRGLL